MGLICDFLYDSGRYTIKGSPFSAENNEKEYELNNYLKNIENIYPLTPKKMLIIGVVKGYIVPNIKKPSGISPDPEKNNMIGRILDELFKINNNELHTN